MFNKGVIVKSCAGKDKDKYSVVIQEAEDYILIADGKYHRLDNPKRKNPKHLECTQEVITLTDMTDKKLRNVLREFSHTVTDLGRY